MPLNPGTSLGPYQIVAPIGQGGPASVRGDMAIRGLWRGLVRLRREAASARPRRSSAWTLTERRWAEAKLLRTR